MNRSNRILGLTLVKFTARPTHFIHECPRKRDTIKVILGVLGS
ncbi:hypothetical protein PanWU01x14_036500 [Parasponia andersonii]|uniref:Uncharacterized protein n=1 Tax=Parasponia andersonii TaxID=3476 RepID=A0A2P5DSI0_PARAD|nr:hypothetical protein PanWU01x14_036500 [Parasponia andersonii]